MRIRKLLGRAICSAPPPLSPAPPPLSVPQKCQLNLSPWDAVEAISPRLSNNSQETKADGGGDVEYGFEAPEMLGEIKSGEDNKPKSKEKETHAEEEDDDDGEMSGGSMKCKKTDGKGWHCKRPAQSPQSLCSYHLAQLRSYRSRPDTCHVSGNSGSSRRNKSSSSSSSSSSSAVTPAEASDQYCYYYYSILGPWWGKRRGPVVDGGGNIENMGVFQIEGDAGGTLLNVEKRPPPPKKRGRKPMKARSLKSLL